MAKPIILHIQADPPLQPSASREELRKAYLREREKLRALSDELVKLEFERDVLQRKLNEKELELHRQAIENEVRSSSVGQTPQRAFEVLRKRFKRILLGLMKEVEALKKIDPVKALLSAKEAELAAMKRAVDSIPRNSQKRIVAEGMLRAHISERDELVGIAESTDYKLDQEIQKMQEILDEELDVSAASHSGHDQTY